MTTKKYSHIVSSIYTLVIFLYDPCRPMTYHSISCHLSITSDPFDLFDPPSILAYFFPYDRLSSIHHLLT